MSQEARKPTQWAEERKRVPMDSFGNVGLCRFMNELYLDRKWVGAHCDVSLMQLLYNELHLQTS